MSHMIALLAFALLTGQSRADHSPNVDTLILRQMDDERDRTDKMLERLTQRIDDLNTQADKNAATIAELQGREKVWGTILGLLSSGSIVFTAVSNKHTKQ